jgi:hypothetical protein
LSWGIADLVTNPRPFADALAERLGFEA